MQHFEQQVVGLGLGGVEYIQQLSTLLPDCLRHRLDERPDVSLCYLGCAPLVHAHQPTVDGDGCSLISLRMQFYELEAVKTWVWSVPSMGINVIVRNCWLLPSR